MKEVFGNIWDWHDAGAWVCIPVNVGWKKDGRNVMGRGVARQAAERMGRNGIDLPMEVGTLFRVAVSEGLPLSVFSTRQWRLIYFPTKPLNRANPALSWQAQSTLGMIEAAASGLAFYPSKILMDTTTPIALPLVGCGNGGLHEDDVLPILQKHLTTDQFVLVRH